MSVYSYAKMATVLSSIALIAGCGGGGAGLAPPTSAGAGNTTPAAGPGARTTLDAAACAALAGHALGDGSAQQGLGKVTSAVWTAGEAASNPAQSTPDHCLVEGTMNARINGLDGSEGSAATSGAAAYGIDLRIRLPAAWNTKTFFEGIGGTAGSLNAARGDLRVAGARDNALMRGYAVVATDTGHRTMPGTNGSFRFGFDPQARLEYGHLFLPIVANAFKTVVKAAYLQVPSRSYFIGSSGGGRQGMKATQMYPELFDAVAVVVPGFRVASATIANMAMVQEQASISRTGVDTVTPDIATAFSRAELNFAAAKILEQCDALDGVADGMVFSPARCAFDSQRLLCTASDPASGCFSQPKIDVFKRIHDGIPQYSPWNFDPGLAADNGWPSHRLGAVNTVAGAPNTANIAGQMAGHLAFDLVIPPVEDPFANPYLYMLNGDPATAFAKLSATSAKFPHSAFSLMNADSPNLDKFAARKGRLLMVHGLADPYFSPADSTRYLDQLNKRYGAEAASDIARLFLVPGMNHGTGGPTTDVYDTLQLIDNWVETGIAPNSYVAGVNPANAALPTSWSRSRTRLICAYPMEAHYRGGDHELATSFECR